MNILPAIYLPENLIEFYFDYFELYLFNFEFYHFQNHIIALKVAHCLNFKILLK